MVTNSVTSTTSTASQTVNVQQQLNLDFSNIKGRVDVSNINQTVNINLSNICNLDMTIMDNIRTDLANQVLENFATNTSAEVLASVNAAILNDLEASSTAVQTAQNSSQVNQEQTNATGWMAMAAPLTIMPVSTQANMTTKEETVNDVETATFTSNEFSLSTDISRTLQTKIVNSVTQNFSHETVTQLMQTVNSNQQMNIKFSNIIGDVKLSNISQLANIVLRQTLTQKMNIGLAITNGIVNGMGISTEDRTSIINALRSDVLSKTKSRTSSSFTQDLKSTYEYTQKVASGSGSSTSCGSSGSSWLSCIIIIICCVAGPLLSSLPMPEMNSSSSEDESEKSTESESVKSTESE
jgi:hypothetical protein